MKEQSSTQKMANRLGNDPLKVKGVFKQLSLCLPNLISNDNLFPANNISNEWKGVKRVEKPDYIFRNLMWFLFAATIVIFVLDVKQEISSEIKRWDIIRQECFQDYDKNQCIDPVQALRDKCRQYKLCYSLSAEERIKFTELVAKLLGIFLQTFLSYSKIQGAIIFLILIAMGLIFVLKSSRGHQQIMIYSNEE